MIIWAKSKRYKFIYSEFKLEFKTNPINQKIRKTFLNELLKIYARNTNKTI